MSVTVQQINDTIPFDDVAQADTIAAVNAAIGAAWPFMGLSERLASAATLVSGTFTYQLTFVAGLEPHPSEGVSRIFINKDTSNPGVLWKHVRQRYDQSDGKFSLVFPPFICSDYNGKTVDVEYRYPHPIIANPDSPVYLHEEFVRQYVLWWYLTKLGTPLTEASDTYLRLVDSQWMRVKDAQAVGRNQHLFPKLPFTQSDRL
jgi:hypothetical protein